MLVRSILVGLVYWVAKWVPGYTSFMPMAYSPMFLSVIVGLIMGDVQHAVMCGAFVQAVYLGLAADLGGVTTVDKALAACVTVAIATANHLEPSTAAAIAIPFGLLGTVTANIVKTFLSLMNHHCDKLAEEGDADKIVFYARFGPMFFWFIFAALPVMFLVYFGTDAMEAVLNAIPQWIINGMSVAGGLLPALGFAMTIRTIGRRNFLPFFFLGFFLVAYFGLGSIGCAIFGSIAAIIYIQLLGGNEEYA